MSIAFPAPTHAATITVNTLTDEPLADPDNGNCSIREAILAANIDAAVDACTAGSGADTITFSVSGTIDLSASGDGEMTITSPITIEGGTTITLDGNNATRLIRVNASGSLSLQNITLIRGNGSGGSGGAIVVDTGATLNVLNSNFNNNSAASNGGAINSSGILDIENAVFQDNTAQRDGGAIYHNSNSSMTIDTAAFINNSAGTDAGYGDGSGGAIYHNGSTSGPSAITAAYFLSNSVTNADSADGGGAIYHGTSGVLTITASAFFDNSASGDDARGGAVYNDSGSDFALTINYSHFGEVFALPIPPIPPINGVNIVAAIGSGSGNRVSGTTATTAGGGAIYNNGYLLMTGTSLVANSSSNHGGAIFNVANSTDTYPQPLGQGILIANSTIANNTATNNGGALYHGSTDDLIELINVTISNNTAASGDGIFNAGDGESPNQSPFDEVYLVNVIVNNDGCAGASLGNGNSSASGNNVIFGAVCDIRQQDAGNSPAIPIVTDPLLGTPTIVFTPATIFTVAIPLGTGSSASGTGDNAVCTSFPVLSIDQRISVRPNGEPACDIGAYESDQVTPVEIDVRDVTNIVSIADGDTSPDLADGTNMGLTPVGTPIIATFNINNVGGGVLNVGIITVSNPTYFSVTQVADNTIDAGNFEPFTVTCLATDGGTYTTTVTIPNNDTDENPFDFVVSCIVAGPEIEVRDATNTTLINIGDTVSIGTTPLGTPITGNLRINNIGNLNLDISSVSVTGDFTIVTPVTPPAFSIGGSGFDFEPLTIQCSATMVGIQTGTVTILSNDNNEPNYSFDVTCNVTAISPEIQVEGNSLIITNGDATPDTADDTDFGSTSVGIPITRTFIIQNLGIDDLTLGAITIPAGFTITTAPASPVTGGNSTSLGITCDAATQNTFAGTVSIPNNDSNENPYTFAITCSVLAAGTPADLSLSKIVDDITPVFSQILTYTVTVNNVGPGATTNVQVVDIFPTSVTFLAVDTVSQGTVTVDISNTFLTWDIGTLTVPQSVTLTYTVQVNPTVGTTENYAQVTNSDVSDPNSTPNNGPQIPDEDDDASIAFLFDPPFATKAFVYDGVSVIEWTVVWVNPTNNPIPVTMNDPLVGGTTYIAGSLSCTTPGTTTITSCVHNPVTNSIEFVGIIDPDPGATPATITSANNRLIITYRVQVPDSVTTVSNTATLTDTNANASYQVTTTFTRTTPSGGVGGTPLTAEQIQGMVKALPATGETPLWADILRVVVLMAVVIGGAGVSWLVLRKRMAG